MDIARVQTEIGKQALDGWLFYDFCNRDAMAYEVLELEFGKFTTRRWFYFIPVKGEPTKIVSAVEAGKLDSLPGKKVIYRSWRQLQQALRETLANHPKVAMNYSPRGNIPYVSVVDGGTVELVRSLGVEVVSAANLLQLFEALIDEAGYQSHLRAGAKIQKIKDEAFIFIRDAVRAGRALTEYDVQQYIVRRFAEEGLTDDGEHPIVGVNEHPADPHFEPRPDNTYVIKHGDTLLIDLWARENQAHAIYYDITWCGYVGAQPPLQYVEIFDVVRRARNAARDFIRAKFQRGERCYGYEVDDVCRQVVEAAGYGEFFVHRTGHSIGHAVHGNGVNMDNLETHDDREIMPGVCFSIEPGIYLPGKMAVRSEINAFITPDYQVVVAGEEQEQLILLD